MGKKIEVPQELRLEIKRLYQEKGYGLEKIKKTLNLSWNQSVIKRVLIEENVQLRTYKEALLTGGRKMEVDKQTQLKIIEAYEKGWGLQRIVKELNLPFSFDKVRSILKDNNIHIRNIQESQKVLITPDLRKFPVNDNYCLESHNGAWLMGFIAADGYLPKTKGARNRITITLAEKDKDILELIAKELNYNGQIYNFIQNIHNKQVKSVSLSFASKKIRTQLENYGIVNNKTFKLEHLPNLPKEYILDFIAGFFDGDGSIGQSQDNKRLFWNITCANKIFLEDIQNFLHQEYNLPSNHIYKDHNVYSLAYSSKQDVLLLGKLFYDNDYLRLPRKRKKYYTIRK